MLICFNELHLKNGDIQLSKVAMTTPQHRYCELCQAVSILCESPQVAIRAKATWFFRLCCCCDSYDYVVSLKDCFQLLFVNRSQLTINWRDKDMALRSTTRRLLLINVTKQDEGVYRCIPDNIASYTASYYVYVIGMVLIA